MGSRARAWVEKALDANKEYTSNEPFKLRFFREGSKGMMSPGSEGERFTGKKVFLLFPWGGSSLDQFASMIVDNPQLGIHTMGLSMGGFSNTWEWEEELKVPQYGKVEFEWSAGHTIRPNGEILEGNPSLAKEWVPMTAKNCGTYFTD